MKLTLSCNYGNLQPQNFLRFYQTLAIDLNFPPILKYHFSKIEFYKEMKAANQLKKIKSTLVILSALSVLLVGFDVLEFSVEWIQERF